MKLFGEFDAIRFQEENLIFVTKGGYLYYIYNPKYKYWRKHRNAGNDHLSVKNYDDISREELMAAMDGVFPKTETDFMRHCQPAQLCIRDMFDIFSEDYPEYFTDNVIYRTVHRFLLDSDVCFKSYLELRKLLDNACNLHLENAAVLSQIKELSFSIIGRDIYKREIKIVDGHDSSSYFWIMPVRVIDNADSDSMDNVAEMRSNEISIEEDDVSQYLTPFLYKYFDENLDANKNRNDAKGFEWYLTYNFFTFEAMEKIIEDIKDTVDALLTGRDNDYTAELRKKRGTATYELLYAKELTEEQIREYNANRPTEDDTEIDLIIDFYRRFIYRMEYMINVGKEKGYNLISFMGP